MNHLKSTWIGIRSSLWFVPAVIVCLSIILALALVELDKQYQFKWVEQYPLLFGAGAEGSRGMLSTIAASMITVAGLTFSLTIAALVTASAQYTSRILRNFMRDRRNQFVLGCFVGIFTYCLVVLRTIRSTDEGNFVPALAVVSGLLLALFGIAILVFFIHHIATSIQASTIIAAITDETIAAVHKMFPEGAGAGALDLDVREANQRRGNGQTFQVRAATRGYVQTIAGQRLVDIAATHDVVVSMEVGPGDFVTIDMPLLTINGEIELSEELAGAFRDAIAIQRYRTIDQEAGFGLRQLVDIALKALSPGINDTTTAVMCIDHLSAILARLAGRVIPSRHRSEDGQVRLVVIGTRFPDMLNLAFDQIRCNAARNVEVIAHLLRAIGTISQGTENADYLASLRHHLGLVADLANDVPVEHDRARIFKHLQQAEVAVDRYGRRT